MNVFDRKAKRWHKNRAAMAPEADTFDYLRDEVLVKYVTTFTIRISSCTRSWVPLPINTKVSINEYRRGVGDGEVGR